MEQFGQMMASIKTDGIRPVLVTILEALRNNRDIIRIMADPTRERSFIYRLAACCLDYMELWMSASIDPEQAGEDQSIEFAFLAGGCSGAVDYWIHNGMKEPPEEIARRIEEFIGTMIGSRMEKSQ